MIQNLNIYLWNMKVGSLVAYKKENRQGLIFQLLTWRFFCGPTWA